MGDEQTMTSLKPSTIPSITDRNGFDAEVSLVEQEDDLDPSIWMGQWIAESFRVAVRDPVRYSSTMISVIYYWIGSSSMAKQ
jgi:hypothetical protein